MRERSVFQMLLPTILRERSVLLGCTACVAAPVGLPLASVRPASSALCTHPGTLRPGLILFYPLQTCARGRYSGVVCFSIP